MSCGMPTRRIGTTAERRSVTPGVWSNAWLIGVITMPGLTTLLRMSWDPIRWRVAATA